MAGWRRERERASTPSSRCNSSEPPGPYVGTLSRPVIFGVTRDIERLRWISTALDQAIVEVTEGSIAYQIR
jgi:hypothetical protein